MNEHALNPVEIFKDEKVTLHIKKEKQTMSKCFALFDAGSVINAVTPRVAEKITKKLGDEHIEVSAFMLENDCGKSLNFMATRSPWKLS